MNTLNAFTNLYSGTRCEYRLPCGLCEKLKEKCLVENTVNYCNDLSNSASAHSYEGASICKEN